MRYSALSRRFALTSFLVFSLATAGACVPTHEQDRGTAAARAISPTRAPSTQTVAHELFQVQDLRLGYTYHSPDGNRLVQGSGSLPGVRPLKVELGFAPAWIAALALDSGSIWAAVSAEGDAGALFVQGETVQAVPIEAESYIAGAPPLMRVDSAGVSIVSAPGSSASSSTHPVILNAAGSIAWIDQDGSLDLRHQDEVHQLNVNALPDARILQDGRGRLLLLSDPTESYDHGVLGDGIEARSIVLIETAPEVRITERIFVPDGLVIEGIMPLWVDLDSDGEREIIITVSDRSVGARLQVYSEMGGLIAESQAIGQGYRWRHQIAVASMSTGTTQEIISVRTPHIGGILEYFQLTGDRVELTATVTGVTSHVIGTRNLDLALVGDFDGDQVVETLLPNDELNHLVAVERTAQGAQVEWSLPLGAKMSSNLAAVTDSQGRISVGSGLTDGSLLIWSE